MSKADCYVKLWLPTASPSCAQTRVIDNCSDPEWNETFHYQIHSAVKVRWLGWQRERAPSESLPTSGSHFCLPCLQNVLELTLYDKDVLASSELSLLLFDLKSLKPGQPHRHTFLLNQQVSCPTCSSNEPGSLEDAQHRALRRGLPVSTTRSPRQTLHPAPLSPPRRPSDNSSLSRIHM